jgi:FKBP-type peptidyl-prolyl cis-trans isomerase FkpA
MKLKMTALLAALIAFQATAQDKKPEQKPAPKTEAKTEAKPAPKEADKKDDAQLVKDVSYAVGMNIAQNWKRQSVEFDVDQVAQGIKDVLGEKTPRLTDEQAGEAVSAYQKKLQDPAHQKKMMEKQQAEGSKNKKEGEAFLAENKKKEGVKTTASGLQYQVIKEGTGKMPKATDTVKVHYLGTLINGKKFDSSYDRKEPIEFPLTGVIKGWTEGMQLMKVGSKYKFFIPSDLAYGENPPPGAPIPPNSALIFEVELLDIKPATAQAPTLSIEPPKPKAK